jgi:hypothetical protein
LNELPFEKSVPQTPSEIFRAIDNRSVNRQAAESLIKRYGDHRVREALADLQENIGIELDKEIGQRIARIGRLIDEFYEKALEIRPSKGRKSGK